MKDGYKYKAKMEMAHLVEDDGCKVYESVGCKAEGKYTKMWTVTFVEEDDASMVPPNPLLPYDTKSQERRLSYWVTAID